MAGGVMRYVCRGFRTATGRRKKGVLGTQWSDAEFGWDAEGVAWKYNPSAGEARAVSRRNRSRMSERVMLRRPHTSTAHVHHLRPKGASYQNTANARRFAHQAVAIALNITHYPCYDTFWKHGSKPRGPFVKCEEIRLR